MGKKVLILIAPLLVIVTALSWAATTWQLQTKLATVGGTIKVRNNATQTAAGSIVYTNFTTSANVPVAVNSLAGYTISGITKNGTSVPGVSGTTSYTASLNKSAGTVQTLIASFAAVTYSASGSTAGPGSVSLSSSSIPYNGSVTIKATPTYTSGYVKTLTVNGTQVAGNFPYPGIFSTTITNVTQNLVVSATFDTVTASSGGSQVTVVSQPVTLSGSTSGGGTTSWVQTSGPAPIDTSGWTTTTPTFSPTVAGTYTFQMNESIGGVVLASATTQVSVSTSVTDYMRNQCNGCHANPGGAAPSRAFGLWSSSGHKVSKINCISCHTDAAMPTPVNTATVDSGTFAVTNVTAGPLGSNYCVTCHKASIASDYDSSPHKANGVTCIGCHVNGAHLPDVADNVCDSCHRDASGNVPGHPMAIISSCVSCHNPHSASATVPNMPAVHYNNQTSAGYPASYVTSRSDCTDCHFYASSNATYRADWSQSGHAATGDAPWMGQDFKTQSGCVQCHTTTGFIAYSTGRVTAAWGDAADKTKEVLTCKGCHSDITTGEVRKVKPVAPFADDSYKNRDIGKSNSCMNCHSGTNNGNSIQVKVGSADFGNLDFVQPHYLPSGAVMHGKAGYHFPGQTYAYYSSNSHRAIGINNQNGTGSSGPCVACHTSGPQPHLFQAAQLDQTGTVTAVLSTACAKCHGGFIDAKTLNAKQADFDNALDILRAMLADKGLTYSENPPYFSNKNWGNGQAGADLMGAAYNYQMLVSEPGAYAHNGAYAKKLIQDSIDLLYNGSVTGSIDTALDYLVGRGAITQAAADALVQYVKNSCTTCHGGTTSTPLPMNSNAHPAHLSADYGTAVLFGSDLGSCEACHVYSGQTHANGTVDMVANPCAGCHPNGAEWNTTGRLDCASCHGVNPSTLPSGVAAPNTAQYFANGHGKFAASSQCTNCHDPNSRHITGSLGNTNRLYLSNDNYLCASCHDDPTKCPEGTNYMAAHNGFSCQTCHDPHGTPNLWMINTTVNGNPVSIQNVYQVVDPVTNRGLCQGCHTTTKYFRAGVPETVHYPTSQCLSCHQHNDPDNAFHAVSDSCDACHGYPPAPRNPSVSFGTPGNWPNAKFEDYSGGGGAHLTVVHVSPFAQASDGWIHCASCHNGGRIDSFPNHVLARPVRTHIEKITIDIDNQYRFSEGFTIYTGAKMVSPPPANKTGSCFNISCHMSPSPRWGTER